MAKFSEDFYGSDFVEEEDGTFTIPALDHFEMESPITGIPTKELAMDILDALQGAEEAGAHHCAQSYVG